jgi:ABC-type antimicrobial peptide transport system permease subunit
MVDRSAASSSDLSVRIALGASRSDVLGLVLRQGMRLAAIGACLGLIGAAIAARAMQAVLYDISPHDPVTLMAVTAVFILIAASACYAPARRAMRVDPIVALRTD